MSASESPLTNPLTDVGRYFRLAERWDIFFDYIPSSNPSNRGTTDRRRKYYEKGSRFRILQHIHAVEASSTDGKTYEVLLVLPVDDDGYTLFDDSPIKIDADFLERVRLITDIPKVLIDQYSNIKDVVDQYSIPEEVAEALKGLKGESYPDWIEFQEAIAGFLPDEERDRIEESLTNATQTGYLWNVYANKPYITLDLSPAQIEEIIQQHKYPKLYKGNTGINVVTLQIWLKMLGFYDGPTSGLLDEDTEDAVKWFRDDQDVPTPNNPLVVDWNTWEAMESILKQNLPPDPYTLERLPFPRRRDYDTEEKYQKALYEGLKRFGFPIPPTDERVEFRLTTDANGIGRLTNIPPGTYDLTIESLNANPTTSQSGSAEINLVDDDGTPMSGTVILSGPEVEIAVTVNTDGMGVMNGISPGEYTLSVKDAKRGVANGYSAGNVEVRLLDQAGQPVSTHIMLSGELGESDAVQKAILLFKAIVRGVDLYENINGENRYPNILSNELDETRSNIEAWNNFSNTWGRFYGAPWAGVTFHSINDAEPGHEQGELNWIEFETLSMLYEWGDAYLQASINEEDLKVRLRRPIAIRHISKSLGGKIDQRADFSQVGTEVSLHLPRKSEIIFEGIASGQTYGGIDYDSPEYSASHLEKQLAAYMSINTDFRALCPDDNLISHFQPKGPLPIETGLVIDYYANARLTNISIAKYSRKYRTSRKKETGKDKWINVLESYREKQKGRIDEYDFDGVNEKFYTWKEVEDARRIFHQEPTDDTDKIVYKMIAWKYIRSIQIGLWWCRLLVRAGELEGALKMSNNYKALGFGGLFEQINKDILDKDIDKWIFSFNDDDWKNLFQLEALAKFYLNYNDPWRPKKDNVSTPGANQPRFWDNLLVIPTEDMSKGLHLVLIDGFGARNNTRGKLLVNGSSVEGIDSSGTKITISESVDISLIKLWARIYFPDDSQRASGTYVIVEKNNRTLTLDGKPRLPSGIHIRWEIFLGNAWLRGDSATHIFNAGNTIRLDEESGDLTEVNSAIDTIYLAADLGRPSRTYRILKVDADKRTLTLDGMPQIAEQSSWHIPAGVSGVHPPLSYKLNYDKNGETIPLKNEYISGYDHYDGLLFIIYNGEVKNRYRFTSYTSRVNTESIRGNRMYPFESYKAGAEYINYAFAVDGTGPGRDKSRRYWLLPNDIVDGGGMSAIYIHYGFDNRSYDFYNHRARGTGSAGCLVSPQFIEFRRFLIDLHKDKFTDLKKENLEKIAKIQTPSFEDNTYRRFWGYYKIEKAITGTLWLIRPDELPLGKYK